MYNCVLCWAYILVKTCLFALTRPNSNDPKNQIERQVDRQIDRKMIKRFQRITFRNANDGVPTAPNQPLAWEPPYASGGAQEIAKKTKKKKMQMTSSEHLFSPSPQLLYLYPLLLLSFFISTLSLSLSPKSWLYCQAEPLHVAAKINSSICKVSSQKERASSLFDHSK